MALFGSNERDIPTFRDTDHLIRWLSSEGLFIVARIIKDKWRDLISSTKIGRDIHREIEHEAMYKAESIPVVVEIYPGGHITVYGDDRVSVRFVKLLDVGNVKQTFKRYDPEVKKTESIAVHAEALAQELAILSLPESHRDVYLSANKILGDEVCNNMCVEEYLRVQWKLEVLEELEDSHGRRASNQSDDGG